jgi:hypothetical protein
MITIALLLFMASFYYVMACLLYKSYCRLFVEIKGMWNGKEINQSNLHPTFKERYDDVMYLPRKYGYYGYLVSLGFVGLTYVGAFIVELVIK